MPSNKELLEAQRYNRRRLVTAFMSGTPGGRELESRPLGRPLIWGGVICLVLVLVAVIMARFVPTLPTGWEDDTLVVVRGTGARYFSIKGVLRPVANITSARLLADPSKFKTSEVDASTLQGIPRGTAVGIVEAPDLVPEKEALKSSTWDACATTGGDTHVWVGGEPSGQVAANAAIVTNQGTTYLIAGGRRHRFAQVEPLIALGLDNKELAHSVSGNWLGLFEAGSDLRAVNVKGAGEVAQGMPSSLPDARVGQVIVLKDDPNGRKYVIVGDGEIAELSPVAYLLQQVGSRVDSGNDLEVSVNDIASLKVVETADLPADWPKRLSDPVAGDQPICASLSISAGRASANLGALPAPTDDSAGFGPGVTVSGGSGALVRSSAGGSLGAVSLVTEPGLAYGIAGDTADTLSRLGYTEADVTTIPAAWLTLVPNGVTLSKDAAWQTVKA